MKLVFLHSGNIGCCLFYFLSTNCSNIRRTFENSDRTHRLFVIFALIVKAGAKKWVPYPVEYQTAVKPQHKVGLSRLWRRIFPVYNVGPLPYISQSSNNYIFSGSSTCSNEDDVGGQTEGDYRHSERPPKPRLGRRTDPVEKGAAVSGEWGTFHV